MGFACLFIDIWFYIWFIDMLVFVGELNLQCAFCCERKAQGGPLEVLRLPGSEVSAVRVDDPVLGVIVSSSCVNWHTDFNPDTRLRFLIRLSKLCSAPSSACYIIFQSLIN
jgi:hypothetical protein